MFPEIQHKATNESSIKEGYLYKQNGMMVYMKTWSKRYFVLENNTLYYYKSKNNMTVEVPRVIQLSQYYLCEIPAKSAKIYAFHLYHPKLPSYIMATVNESDLQDWITKLKPFTLLSNQRIRVTEPLITFDFADK